MVQINDGCQYSIVTTGTPPHKKYSLRIIHLLMLVCAILASTSFTVGKAITEGMEPELLTFLRFFTASCILFPLVATRHKLFYGWITIRNCAIISWCLVIFFWCMFLSLRYTSALNTSIIFTLVPSFSGIYALLLLRERLSTELLIGLACGLAGAIWVVFRGDISLLLNMQWNRGDIIFLLGCLAMGLYTPLVKLFHRDEPMVVMTFWILATGSIWLLIAAAPQLMTLKILQVAPSVWVGIAYLALFCTVTTFFLTQYSIAYIGPTRVIAYSYLYPALVLVLDIILGHGWPGGKVLPGILIVFLAMVALQRSAGKAGES